MRPITDRQRTVLVIIHEYIKNEGFAPTLRDLGQAAGIKSTNGVTDHLVALEKKGFITRPSGLARAIRVTESGLDILGLNVRAIPKRAAVHYCPHCGYPCAIPPAAFRVSKT